MKFAGRVSGKMRGVSSGSKGSVAGETTNAMVLTTNGRSTAGGKGALSLSVTAIGPQVFESQH